MGNVRRTVRNLREVRIGKRKNADLYRKLSDLPEVVRIRGIARTDHGDIVNA